MLIDLISSLVNGADIRSVLPGIVFTVIVVLFSLSFHEMAHGYIAFKLGDPTARNLGRLTLNPSKHLDPIGTIGMLLFGFGWAKPVPVNTRYFKKPRRDMALTALAGPVSNLLVSFVSLLIMRIVLALSPEGKYLFYASNFYGTTELVGKSIGLILISLVALLFMYSHLLNLYLAIFNLIPIPPLDGSRILFIFLPDKIYFGIMKYERYIMIALLLLLWRGYLSAPLSALCSYISMGMDWIISLIPGL